MEPPFSILPKKALPRRYACFQLRNPLFDLLVRSLGFRERAELYRLSDPAPSRMLVAVACTRATAWAHCTAARKDFRGFATSLHYALLFSGPHNFQRI